MSTCILPRALASHPGVTSITAIDIADGMLGVARRELPAGRFISGTAEHLPFPHRSFDSVLCVSAFVYVDVPAFLSEAARVLRPHGGAFVTCFTEDGITVPRLLREAAHEFGVEVEDPNAPSGTRERLERLARRARLTISRWEEVRRRCMARAECRSA